MKRRRRRRGRRKRKSQRPAAPASFSRAEPTRWSPPTGAGLRALAPLRAAHVPVGRWRGVRAAGWCAGGAPGLLMPRTGARREEEPRGGRQRGGKERKRERALRARKAAPAGAEGRRAPGRTAPPHPPRRCTPRSTPSGETSPRNFRTWPGQQAAVAGAAVASRALPRSSAPRQAPERSLPEAAAAGDCARAGPGQKMLESQGGPRQGSS